jgi:hypothetical protein
MAPERMIHRAPFVEGKSENIMVDVKQNATVDRTNSFQTAIAVAGDAGHGCSCRIWIGSTSASERSSMRTEGIRSSSGQKNTQENTG